MSNKNRKARLDADGTAKPYTVIKQVVNPGKLNMGDNIVAYEIQSNNPHK